MPQGSVRHSRDAAIRMFFAALVAFAWLLGKVLCQLVGFAIAIGGFGHWVLAQRDHRPEFRVFAVELYPIFKAGFGIGSNGVSRAFWLANAAVDALIWMDYQHILALVETIHGAHLDAVGVFTSDTVVDHDIGHSWARHNCLDAGLNPVGGINQGAVSSSRCRAASKSRRALPVGRPPFLGSGVPGSAAGVIGSKSS